MWICLKSFHMPASLCEPPTASIPLLSYFFQLPLANFDSSLLFIVLHSEDLGDPDDEPESSLGMDADASICVRDLGESKDEPESILGLFCVRDANFDSSLLFVVLFSEDLGDPDDEPESSLGMDADASICVRDLGDPDDEPESILDRLCVQGEHAASHVPSPASNLTRATAGSIRGLIDLSAPRSSDAW